MTDDTERKASGPEWGTPDKVSDDTWRIYAKCKILGLPRLYSEPRTT